MANRQQRRSQRNDGFTVVEMPLDPALCLPLFNVGAHLHYNETAESVFDGGIPSGAILSHHGRQYLVYACALYQIDCAQYILSDIPALIPFEHVRTHTVRWKRTSNSNKSVVDL